VEETDDGFRVRGDLQPLNPTDIKTMPYPGFPTDMQPQFMAFLTTVEGSSSVVEKVFENRYMHIRELQLMGARIATEGNNAEIQGGYGLKGARVKATDLRAGAALVLAGLVAEGVTEVSNVHYVERGYADFTGKLKRLGARIEKVED
jgi:UDP-N-acetylglucosamine 1-carboxyvinyltransferase